MSIRRRLVIVFLLTLVPLLALALGLLGAWYSSQRAAVAGDRLNNARLVATAFRTTVDDIAATSFVIDESVLASQPVSVEHPALQRLVASFPLRWAAVLDERGRVIQASDRALIGRSIEDSAVARAVERRGQAIGVSRELFGSRGFVLAQWAGGTEGPYGVGVQFVDPARLSSRLGQNQIAGGAHVVDSKGRLVALFEYPALADEGLDWSRYRIVREALDGNETVDFSWTFPPTGKRRVGASVPISGIGWEAGSAIDYETAFGPFQRSLALALVVAVVVLIASALAVRATSLRLIESIQAITRQSEAVGRRDREPPGVVRTGDELEQVSAALDRADNDLRAYIGGIEAIGEAGQDLSASFASGKVHDAVVSAARKLFDASAVWVFLYNEESRKLRCVLYYSAEGGSAPSRELNTDQGVVGRVFTTGEIAIEANLSEVDGFVWRGLIENAPPGEALIEIPLLEAHRRVGVLGVLAPGIERWQLGGREIGLLTAFGSEVSIALQNARLYENERLVAETLQQALLLMPEHVAGVRFAHAYYSGTGELKVGGDFYDVFELSEERVGVLIGDVSGKGLPAAVLTSVVKDTVRAHADEPDKPPAQVVQLTNQLVEKQSASDMFVTLFLGCVDTRAETITYCNAGHTTGALLCTDGRVERLGSTSPIAGAFPEIEYEQADTGIAVGDILFLYTDGLTEARRGNQLYGEERLFSLLARLRPDSPQELLHAVYREVCDYAENQLGDDLAMLAVQLGEDDNGFGG